MMLMFMKCSANVEDKHLGCYSLGQIAYAYINLDGPSDNPAPFICAALFSVAPTVHFMRHASS